MQEILTLIYSNGNLQPIKTLPNWARAPWLEHTYFQEQLQHIGCPRLLTTHLPQSVLAPALKKAKPKVRLWRSSVGSLQSQHSQEGWQNLQVGLPWASPGGFQRDIMWHSQLSMA